MAAYQDGLIPLKHVPKVATFAPVLFAGQILPPYDCLDGRMCQPALDLISAYPNHLRGTTAA